MMRQTTSSATAGRAWPAAIWATSQHNAHSPDASVRVDRPRQVASCESSPVDSRSHLCLSTLSNRMKAVCVRIFCCRSWIGLSGSTLGGPEASKACTADTKHQVPPSISELSIALDQETFNSGLGLNFAKVAKMDPVYPGPGITLEEGHLLFNNLGGRTSAPASDKGLDKSTQTQSYLSPAGEDVQAHPEVFSPLASAPCPTEAKESNPAPCTLPRVLPLHGHGSGLWSRVITVTQRLNGGRFGITQVHIHLIVLTISGFD